jgi:hypothetical protein
MVLNCFRSPPPGGFLFRCTESSTQLRCICFIVRYSTWFFYSYFVVCYCTFRLIYFVTSWPSELYFFSHYAPPSLKRICRIFPSYFMAYIPFHLALFVFFRMKLVLISPFQKRKERKYLSNSGAHWMDRIWFWPPSDTSCIGFCQEDGWAGQRKHMKGAGIISRQQMK